MKRYFKIITSCFTTQEKIMMVMAYTYMLLLKPFVVDSLTKDISATFCVLVIYGLAFKGGLKLSRRRKEHAE